MADEEFSLCNFLEDWTTQQRRYLDQLISSQNNPNEHELKLVVNQVIGHYQLYYEAKSRVARQDVFSLFSPTWFTTYERSFLWITGFRPGLAFQLVNHSVKDLSPDQMLRMKRLKAETNGNERELSNELARLQESLATVNLVELTREVGRQLDGVTSKVNVELERLREGMQILVQSADYFRMQTAREILEILNPVQSVKLLTAATQFQIQIRTLGKHRDAQRSR